MRVEPGQERSARRTAAARVVELGEAQPVFRERVEVRRGDLGTVAPEVGEAHVVDQDHDDVRLGGGRRQGGDAREKQGEEAGHILFMARTDPRGSRQSPAATLLALGRLGLLLRRLGRGGRLVLGHEVVDREQVAGEAEAGDDAFARGGGHGLMSEFLPLVDVGDVHLDDLHAGAGEAVAQGHADVRVAARVDDQELHAVVRPLGDGVDQLALVVGLEEAGLHAGLLGVRGDRRLEVGEGGVAVDLRFALAEPVEVGAVDDADFHAPVLGRAG